VTLTSVWLREILQWHRAAILDCIQQRVGKEVVRKISYQVNDLPSKYILPDFRISESLIKLSATLQPTASGSAPALPAQDLVRTALNSAGAASHIIVSFRPEGSSSASGILKEPPQGSVGDIFTASKSDKLEVFAEDDFTFQRCGRNARDVILCLGEASKCGAFNRSFITICIECDHAIRPKGSSIRDALSSDESLRNEQFELMGEFQRLSEHWSTLVPHYSLSSNQKGLICNLISKFKPEEIMIAMRKAAHKYIETGIPRTSRYPSLYGAYVAFVIILGFGNHINSANGASRSNLKLLRSLE
jgi:hypothetical protein